MKITPFILILIATNLIFSGCSTEKEKIERDKSLIEGDNNIGENIISNSEDEIGECFDLLSFDGLVVTGYILEIETSLVTIVKNISLGEFNKIKDLSVQEILSKENQLSIMYLDYNQSNDLKNGDHIVAFLTGGVNSSFPSTGTAKKIIKVDF
nr:DUF3221 domain-containing protein [Paenibacillus bovis]